MDTTTPVDTQTRTRLARDTQNKHLLFTLGTEEFGIQVLNIKEIMQMQDVTPVPQTPPYVRGVINLRGQVIPVVDLSLRFQMSPREVTPRTCIVVVRHKSAAGERFIGAVADGVNEVVTIPESEIEDSPDFGEGSTVPYLLGMAKVKGKVKLLLDINQVFNAPTLSEETEPEAVPAS